MDNVNRFLNAFSMIEQQCKELVDEDRYVKFYILIQKAAAKNRIVSHYRQEIEEYADLRNAIIHQRTKEGNVIAIPVDEAVEEIEKIAKMLKYPPIIKDYFLKEVKGCCSEDLVTDVYESMKEISTSKYPIFKNGQFEGLLTLEMVLEWAIHRKGDSVPAVIEIFKPQKNEKVYFISKNAAVLEALKLFENALRNGFNLLAVLITENGRKTEKVEGIITIADLPTLYELAESV